MKRLCRIITKPSDTKEDDFHLALAEYLHKELKHGGLNSNKHSATVKIILPDTQEYKYNCIIVDCLEGKIYLRGNNVRDKYFGRLRRFRNGNRVADAYHCVVQSAKRLINRVKKLMDVLGIEKGDV